MYNPFAITVTTVVWLVWGGLPELILIGRGINQMRPKTTLAATASTATSNVSSSCAHRTMVWWAKGWTALNSQYRFEYRFCMQLSLFEYGSPWCETLVLNQNVVYQSCWVSGDLTRKPSYMWIWNRSGQIKLSSSNRHIRMLRCASFGICSQSWNAPRVVAMEFMFSFISVVFWCCGKHNRTICLILKLSLAAFCFNSTRLLGYGALSSVDWLRRSNPVREPGLVPVGLNFDLSERLSHSHYLD